MARLPAPVVETADDIPSLEKLEGQVATAGVWRPDMGISISIWSFSSNDEYPPAHGLQEELDQSGWNGTDVPAPTENGGPVSGIGVPFPITLMFFEDDSPTIDLELGDTLHEVTLEDGTVATTRDSHFLEIAAGTQVVRRWEEVGLSYQHWVTRALLAAFVTPFPRNADPSDLESVLTPQAGRSSQDASHGEVRSFMSLSTVDPRRPGYAAWRAHSEILEHLRVVRFKEPSGYLLTLHAYKWMAFLNSEMESLRKLIEDEDVPFFFHVDTLDREDHQPFVSLVASSTR